MGDAKGLELTESRLFGVVDSAMLELSARIGRLSRNLRGVVVLKRRIIGNSGISVVRGCGEPGPLLVLSTHKIGRRTLTI
jgi:hypothetical protein